MGASNSADKNIKYYSLKGKASSEETPNFALAAKVEGKWAVVGNYDTMTGLLCSAEIKEKEYNGIKFNVFIIVMEDGTETSQIEMTHNQVTHSLINSLASDCNKLEEYSFVVKKKQSQANGKTYWNGTAYVNVKGRTESLRWSIDPQSAPKKEAVMVNGTQFMQSGKAVWDDTKVKLFWEGVFRDKIMSVLGKAASVVNTSSANQPVSTTTNAPIVTSQPDDLGDMPF